MPLLATLCSSLISSLSFPYSYFSSFPSFSGHFFVSSFILIFLPIFYNSSCRSYYFIFSAVSLLIVFILFLHHFYCLFSIPLTHSTSYASLFFLPTLSFIFLLVCLSFFSSDCFAFSFSRPLLSFWYFSTFTLPILFLLISSSLLTFCHSSSFFITLSLVSLFSVYVYFCLEVFFFFLFPIPSHFSTCPYFFPFQLFPSFVQRYFFFLLSFSVCFVLTFFSSKPFTVLLFSFPSSLVFFSTPSLYCRSPLSPFSSFFYYAFRVFVFISFTILCSSTFYLLFMSSLLLTLFLHHIIPLPSFPFTWFHNHPLTISMFSVFHLF